MTSEEIQTVKNQLIDDPRIDTNVAQAAALYEIAYQLAVMNQRDAVKNPGAVLCRCGHSMGEHGVTQSHKTVCYGLACQCHERRPA